jgi:hypothetical protein
MPPSNDALAAYCGTLRAALATLVTRLDEQYRQPWWIPPAVQVQTAIEAAREALAVPPPMPDDREQYWMQQLADTAYELADFTHYTLYGCGRSDSPHMPTGREATAALQRLEMITQQLNAVQVDHDDPNERPHDATP